MDINTFSTYFIDNAKKVIDPIVYAGRYGRTKTKILNQPDYMYGYYGVYGDWGGLCAIYDIMVRPKSINLKCGIQYLNNKNNKTSRISANISAIDDAVNGRMVPI